MEMKMSDRSPDVWDSANEATVAPKVYFGQIFTDAFFCVLQKGVGKLVFDPSQHNEDRKLTCINIDGNVARADGTTYTIHREVIAEFRDWAGIVLPSLKVAGVHPRDLNEQWARWEMTKTGRTWVDRNSGETKEGTTFKFLEFYSDEETCRAAETAHYSRPTPIPTEDSSALDKSHPMPEEAVAPANDAQREVAAKFLPALWKTAKEDVTIFGELIAGNPLTSKFFDLNSAEVAAIVAEAVTA
jgi:hypothetical protein